MAAASGGDGAEGGGGGGGKECINVMLRVRPVMACDFGDLVVKTDPEDGRIMVAKDGKNVECRYDKAGGGRPCWAAVAIPRGWRGANVAVPAVAASLRLPRSLSPSRPPSLPPSLPRCLPLLGPATVMRVVMRCPDGSLTLCLPRRRRRWCRSSRLRRHRRKCGRRSVAR